MKVSYNWLKDFVEIKIPPKELADKLTMAGLEVTSLQEREGDFVFELEVTSNRPDCLSVIGIAREVAAILGHRLKVIGNRPNKKYPRPTTYDLPPFSIEIQDKKDCPLYTAKIIRDVKVGPSPDWLKKRLELAGCRSVNNIVDITNYILFEWGQPLHAFDLDKLSPGGIIVRRAKAGEKIITLDGAERALAPDILVIADKEKPVAIAGIIGGEAAEVTEASRNILLEAAVFNPLLIRHVRQKLRAQTDSSYRFERGVDLTGLKDISLRAVGLILRACQGEYVLAKDSAVPKLKKQKVELDIPDVQKILGVNIASRRIKAILNSLGFKVRPQAKKKFNIEVPSYRQDINSQIDLIEELSRIFGYANVPASLPAIMPQASAYNTRDLVSLVKNMLAGLGLNEVITYGLVDKDLLQLFAGEQAASAIAILNPLSEEQAVLRPTLIPSLARCVAYNLNQKQEHIGIFEIARAFAGGGANMPQEELVLGIAICGVKSSLIEQGAIKEKLGVLHLKGVLEAVFERLGIKDYKFASQDSSEAAVYIAGERIGLITRLSGPAQDKLDIKNKDVILGEFSLDKIIRRVKLEKKFVNLPAYPGISRDISFFLKEDIPAGDILEAIKDKGAPLLKEAKIVDYYTGKQVPAGFRGLTVSCLYRSDERTLTEAEINPAHSSVVGLLAERFGAKTRLRP